MRTRFCKMYHNYEVSDFYFEHMLAYFDDVELNGDRVIVTNGEDAAKVCHWLFGKWEMRRNGAGSKHERVGD